MTESPSRPGHRRSASTPHAGRAALDVLQPGMLNLPPPLISPPVTPPSSPRLTAEQVSRLVPPPLPSHAAPSPLLPPLPPALPADSDNDNSSDDAIGLLLDAAVAKPPPPPAATFKLPSFPPPRPLPPPRADAFNPLHQSSGPVLLSSADATTPPPTLTNSDKQRKIDSALTAWSSSSSSVVSVSVSPSPTKPAKDKEKKIADAFSAWSGAGSPLQPPSDGKGHHRRNRSADLVRRIPRPPIPSLFMFGSSTADAAPTEPPPRLAVSPPPTSPRSDSSCLFGASLQAGHNYCSQRGLVHPVEALCAALAAHVNEPGLFRLSGNQTSLARLIARLDVGEPLDAVVAAGGADFADPHLLASALKKFFHKLPDSLVPSSLFAAAVDTCTVADPDARLARTRSQVLAELPPLNQQVLSELVRFLATVDRSSAHNQMPASNLGIVFGPTLCVPPPATPVDLMLEFNAFVEFLVLHAAQLFPVQQPI